MILKPVSWKAVVRLNCYTGSCIKFMTVQFIYVLFFCGVTTQLGSGQPHFEILKSLTHTHTAHTQ
jgi:hypothetical protein